MCTRRGLSDARSLFPPARPARYRVVVRQAEDNEGGRGEASPRSSRMAQNGILIAQARALLEEAEAAWQALPPDPERPAAPGRP